jgi:peptidoglycan hydrolase-like protein with peptidoglycan-binding domain
MRANRKGVARAGLALIALLACQGVLWAQSRPAGAAETAFWEHVKDSSNLAEIRAYLEAYPTGAYADLARARLEVLAPSAPADALPSAASVLTSPEIVREVQERLYNLNYTVAVTGRLSKDTHEAISAWQQVVRRPVTGELDGEGLQLLRSARMPSVWGALAFVARGGSAVVWNRTSRGEAERDALAECSKRSEGGTCQVVTAAESACGALGFYTGMVRATRYWGAFPAIAPSLGLAVERALSACREQAKRPEACGVRLTFCADGSHKQ